VRRPDRLSLGLGVAALVLCCAAPVLVATGLAAAALGIVRQHWGWIAAGVGLVAVIVLLHVQRVGAR
jgi:type IV secretory pathway TrbD component